MTKFNILILFFLFEIIINENLTDGVYEIKYQDLYLNFYHKQNKFYFSRKSSLSKSSLFRIYNELYINSSFFMIESLAHNKKFHCKQNNFVADTKYDKSDKNFFWSFINNNKSSVIIKNKNGYYIQVLNSNKITCIDSIENASHFYLFKIYEEVYHTEEDIKLIEKEPIDILIN